MIAAILDSLESNKNNPPKIVEYLDVLVQIFSINYYQLHRSFFHSCKGINLLGMIIVDYASNKTIVKKMVDVFTAMAKNTDFSKELEHSNIIGIVIQILLRFPDNKCMIKNALSILRYVCNYSSSASSLIPYIPQLNNILLHYQKSTSICESIIYILALISKIGEQSKLSILQSNIYSKYD